MGTGMSEGQIQKVNEALESAHWLFVSLSGYPIIRIIRNGRLLSAGQPQYGIDPTYENLTITTYAEMDEVEQDEINVSGGNIQVGDRRMSTRIPVYNDDRIEMTELIGIHKLETNQGIGGLLSVVVTPNTPATHFTIKFTSSNDFMFTNASGLLGNGIITSKFTNAASGISIHNTAWFGTHVSGDKFLLRTTKNYYNVYRMEAINSFGSYEFLVRLVGETS